MGVENDGKAMVLGGHGLDKYEGTLERRRIILLPEVMKVPYSRYSVTIILKVA